jgi:hypothetical protein
MLRVIVIFGEANLKLTFRRRERTGKRTSCNKSPRFSFARTENNACHIPQEVSLLEICPLILVKIECKSGFLGQSKVEVGAIKPQDLAPNQTESFRFTQNHCYCFPKSAGNGFSFKKLYLVQGRTNWTPVRGSRTTWMALGASKLTWRK